VRGCPGPRLRPRPAMSLPDARTPFDVAIGSTVPPWHLVRLWVVRHWWYGVDWGWIGNREYKDRSALIASVVGPEMMVVGNRAER
jgi:hypothetical protein